MDIIESPISKPHFGGRDNGVVYGTQHWYKNGELHREGDMPAYIGADGTQKWYKNGKLHRDGDKPAIIWPDGTQEWFQNGKQYRAVGGDMSK